MIVNISDKHRAFFWAPNKTASTLATKIFDNFDFYAYDSIRNEKVSNKVNHVHSNCFFDGHENYDFILTCRNPYDRFLSANGYSRQPYEKVKFELENYFADKREHIQMIMNLQIRKPDYIIKTETILEDYLKIPFIKESELYQSGKLKQLIDSKPNRTVNEKSREVLDTDLADLIYYNNITFFDLGGYEKDSWK